MVTNFSRKTNISKYIKGTSFSNLNPIIFSLKLTIVLEKNFFHHRQSPLQNYGNNILNSGILENSSRYIRHIKGKVARWKHFLLWWAHAHVHEVKRMFSIVMSMKLWLILQRLRYKTAWHSMEMKTSIKNVPISKFKLFFLNARLVSVTQGCRSYLWFLNVYANCLCVLTGSWHALCNWRHCSLLLKMACITWDSPI